MKKLQVVLLTVLVSVMYGIIHDQITARICLEYFTLAHPPLFPTTSTTLLALCWGIAATAGLGIVLGILLALVSQAGAPPPWPLPRLLRSLVWLLAFMAGSAIIAGLTGYELSRARVISMPVGLAAMIPSSRHDRFMAVWFAHGASYLIGLGGSMVLYFWIWIARGRPRVIALFPKTRAAVFRTLLLALAAAYALWFRFGAH